jgi:hypothetical protein
MSRRQRLHHRALCLSVVALLALTYLLAAAQPTPAPFQVIGPASTATAP